MKYDNHIKDFEANEGVVIVVLGDYTVHLRNAGSADYNVKENTAAPTSCEIFFYN